MSCKYIYSESLLFLCFLIYDNGLHTLYLNFLLILIRLLTVLLRWVFLFTISLLWRLIRWFRLVLIIVQVLSLESLIRPIIKGSYSAEVQRLISSMSIIETARPSSSSRTSRPVMLHTHRRFPTGSLPCRAFLRSIRKPTVLHYYSRLFLGWRNYSYISTQSPACPQQEPQGQVRIWRPLRLDLYFLTFERQV